MKSHVFYSKSTDFNSSDILKGTFTFDQTTEYHSLVSVTRKIKHVHVAGILAGCFGTGQVLQYFGRCHDRSADSVY